MQEEKKIITYKKTLLWYWRITRQYRFSLWTIMFLYGLGILFADVFTVVIFKKIVDAVTIGISQMPEIWKLFVILVSFHFFHFILFRLGDVIWGRYQTFAAKDLTQFVFSKIQNHSYGFFINRFSGSIVAQGRRFVDGFENVLDTFIFWIWMNTIQLTGSFVVLAFFSWKLAFTFFVFSVGITLLVAPLAKWKARIDSESAEQNSKVTARFSDLVGNILNVKMFSASHFEEQEYKKIVKEEADVNLKAYKAWNILTAVQNGLSLLFQLSMFAVSLYLWQKGEITAGTVVLAQTFTLSIFHIVWSLTRSASRVMKAFADAQEMVDIFEENVEVKDLENAGTLNVTQGEIVFADVNFGYSDGQSVFQDFNLRISPGEKIGLVGPSGGGKSTITKLLLRFMDPTSGSIRIDGQNIREVKQNDLRSAIAYVPQEPLLFHRTLRENIAYGKLDATEEEIVEAARKAHAHEFIETLEKGYDTLVGERGIKLSGGQRQRIAIARAILKNAPILVLDEATSALDTISELAIREAVDELIQNKTAIIIAHRLSTVEKMDRIIVLDKNGQIQEEGSHKVLVSQGGLYSTLWNHQTGGFLPPDEDKEEDKEEIADAR